MDKSIDLAYKRVIELTIELNTDVAILQSNFEKYGIERFKTSTLRKRLGEVVQKCQLYKTCKKIIAFGGGSLCSPCSLENAVTRVMWNQHAALLAIRDMMGREGIKIYLQDPAYLQLDEAFTKGNLKYSWDKYVDGEPVIENGQVLQEEKDYNMEIVHPGLGHQQGFVKIDDSTLVVDLRSMCSLYAIMDEAVKPAAFFATDQLDPPEALSPIPEVPYYHKIDLEGGKTIDIPGLS